MSKRTKLTNFENGEITALKKVVKSQKEISKAFGRSKTIVCNYLKRPNICGTRKPTSRPEKIIITIQENNCSRSKKENFVNIKNIVNSSGCSLQYQNN